MASRDFFISYNRFDQQWAEWVAWVLEEAGYSVVIQSWDFRPGGNFVLDMQRAAADSNKTIAILSETYLNSAYTQPEWAAAFADDPSAIERKLLPIRVKPCNPTGMLKPIVYVDLVDVPQAEAKQKVLDMVKERVKPNREPAFPGTAQPMTSAEEAPKVQFPGEKIAAKSRVAEIKLRNLEALLTAREEEYNALFEQVSNTLDGGQKVILERRIASMEQEITKIAEDIDRLKA
ncbi:MAG: TIR domain-containing protein [Prochlorotrichaceae cyanobacterium]|jgi:hypothetical protein